MALSMKRGDAFPGKRRLAMSFEQGVAAEARRVTSDGSKIVKKKESIGEHGYIARATDTEGSVFGLDSVVEVTI
jgi:predicted enzyme related to lactoylglutathione lyase